MEKKENPPILKKDHPFKISYSALAGPFGVLLTTHSLLNIRYISSF